MTTGMETYTSGGVSLPLEVFAPASSGKFPVVLILHGSFGMLPKYRADIESFGEALEKDGIAAVIPHYLESTGDVPGLAVLSAIDAKHLLWRRACVDALTAIAGDARFGPARIGALGFSLGGHLALSLAMAPPAAAPLLGVVDFFGPTHLLDPHWSRLPPALIFHGDNDPLVEIGHSDRLVAGLEAAGRTQGTDFFYEIKTGEGHGFKGTALAESRERTVEFFRLIFQNEAD